MSIKSRVEKLFPYSYSIVSDGNDNAIPKYVEELPFKVSEFKSGLILNGWVIPPKWSVEIAEIRKNGDLIYDGLSSNLGVAVLSPSFQGKISLTKLKSHLVYNDKIKTAVPYHWKNLYNQKKIDWFFSMPKTIVDNLEDGDYDVNLVTKTKSGTMKVLDYILPGETDETVLLNGHNCHPFQANDDLSGVCVAIEAIKRLSKLPSRRLTYRILIGPELHGPMFWLSHNWKELKPILKSIILLKSVGNDSEMRLQKSYEGNSPVDISAVMALSRKNPEFESGPYRSIYGNDETVFEAPPYNIPTITLTRWPFLEYHTDQDIPSKLSEESLVDSAQTVFEICKYLEYNISFERKFEGLVCLSSHGLYKSVPVVDDLGVDYSSARGRWNRLMNCLPREIEKEKTIIELSEKFNLPVMDVYEYLMEWVSKGLLEIKR